MGVRYQYFLLLLLVALAFAQIPAIPPDLKDVVSNSTMNSTARAIGHQDKVLRYSDLMSSPEPTNRYTNPTGMPATAVDCSNGGTYTVDIRMSNNKQHVAEFHGQRLFDIIHEALLKICPYERGRIGCYETMPSAGKPNNDLAMTYEYASKYWILEVPYVTDEGDYATNAWITITARAIFRNWKYPGLGAATYEMAAGVYARATEHPANCYTQVFDQQSRVYRFCNVPKQVMIALPAEDGSVTESWLSMTVEFNGHTWYGKFDCEGTKKGVKSFWDTAVLPDMAKVLHYPENEWNMCISCMGGDDAFDVETWREHCVCLGGNCQARS